MSKDCKHRQRYKCLKLNKNVSIDLRDPDNPKCWLQPKNLLDGCKNYEANGD